MGGTVGMWGCREEDKRHRGVKILGCREEGAGCLWAAERDAG